MSYRQISFMVVKYLVNIYFPTSIKWLLALLSCFIGSLLHRGSWCYQPGYTFIVIADAMEPNRHQSINNQHADMTVFYRHIIYITHYKYSATAMISRSHNANHEITYHTCNLTVSRCELVRSWSSGPTYILWWLITWLLIYDPVSYQCQLVSMIYNTRPDSIIFLDH